jgi:hypothetical protein
MATELSLVSEKSLPGGGAITSLDARPLEARLFSVARVIRAKNFGPLSWVRRPQHEYVRSHRHAYG